MQTKRFRAAILTLLACGSVAVACSDDDENPSTPAPGGSGGTAAGSGGTSGTGGSGGSTVGTGGTGVGGAPTIMCGTQTCTGLPGNPLLPGGIAACCTGPAMDKCGIDGSMLGQGCVETNQPGNRDDTCFANDGGSAGGSGGGSGSGGSAGATGPDASGDDASTSDSGSDDATAGSAGASGASGAGGTAGGGGRGGLPITGCCKPNGVCGILLNIPGVLELGCVEIPAVDGGPAPQACTPSGS